MNILAVKKNRFQMNELIEFFAGHDLFPAATDTAAIRILKNTEIRLALVSINNHSDFGLIRYINDNYKEIKVILTIRKEMQVAFSVISSGRYNVIENPLKLKELRRVLK